MPTTSFSELVDELAQELESIVARFKTPVPSELPYSESCPPAHEASQSFLVICLQSCWINYTQELIELSMEGGQPTLSGSVIAQSLPPEEAKKRIREAANAAAPKLNMPNPVWQSCSFVVQVARDLQLQNAESIELSLGANKTVDYTNSVRNYLVHPESGSRQRYRKVAATFGLPNAEPIRLLNDPQLGGIPLFEYWIRSTMATAQNAAQ